jgi:hypothetical protein
MSRFLAALLIAVLVLLDVAPAYAQSEDTMVVAQESRRRTLFDLLFGEEAEPAPVVQQQAPRRSQQQAPTATALPAPQPQVEKETEATRLAVFGDSLAIDLSRALDRFYAEDPNLVVIDEGVSSSGFVRDDYFDWNAAIEEEIAANSFDLAVVIIGINDRQAISIGGESYDSLTEPWIEAYGARITEFLAKLRAAGKPVIWVGLPPMSKNDYSAAISQISNIQRLASFSGGAEFVDIYERFLGEDGKYSSHGPDLRGQNARMRKDDGIHFSADGADKLAFYLSQAIDKFYRGGGIAVAIADPLAGTDAAAMLRPPYQGVGQIRLLEVAGAVIPITRVPARAADLLTAGTVPPPPLFTLDEMVQAPVGRVDAFGVGFDPSAPVENASGR